MVPEQTITGGERHMAELERVLEVLLHDLRSPLSVASGYVRLLRLERLDSFEARDKAWSHTATALSRIAHLCDEAVGFLPSTEGVPRVIAASTLVTRVRQRCQEAGVVCEPDPDQDAPVVLDAEPLLRARADVDQLAHAVTTLASLHHSTDHPARVRAVVTATGDQRALEFVIPIATSPDAGEEVPFDPWRRPGLSAPLACHVITLASGHVRTGRNLVISFPLQESPS
jgi:light-regulated signal transduction histidine kinase (bacteriophytochrome)